MSKSYINIDGQTRDSSQIDMDQVSRTLREAWQLSGDVVEYNLPKLKAMLHDLVDEWRDEQKHANITVNGVTYHADEVSTTNIMGAVQMAGIASQFSQPFSVVWSDINQADVTLDGTGITQLGLALGQRTAVLYPQARQICTDIDNAADVDAIKTILDTNGISHDLG